MVRWTPEIEEWAAYLREQVWDALKGLFRETYAIIVPKEYRNLAVIKQMINVLKAANVFLDTEVFVEANFSYKSPRLASVAELSKNGRIRVYLTEITVREIKAKIKELIERAAAVRHHSILRNSSLPQVRVLFEPLDTTEIEKDLVGQFEAFIKDATITILPVKDKFLGPVMESYFNRLPPFGIGKNKAEFPDALALETLREYCRVEGCGMAVVTRDGGIKAACSDHGPLYHFEQLPEYLDTVASEDEVMSSFIREMILHHDKEIFEKAKKAFPYLGFYLNDVDGDVQEVELTDIDFDGDVEIISLTANKASIEVPATLNFMAFISYYIPGTGTYDSEDDVIFFPETAETTVTRSAHRNVAVDVTFENLSQESFRIEEVWFEGKQDIGVRSDYDEDWPYK
jgi:hypothetical protein